MATFIERWQAYSALLDQVALAYAQGVLDTLPKPVVFLIAVIAVFGAILFGRQMARGMNPKAPPTFEGIPLIGGILKFAKVRKPSLAHLCLGSAHICNAAFQPQTRAGVRCMHTSASACLRTIH